MSQYEQTSFSGGMNLLGDDTRIGTNQYRAGFNVRNRFDKLEAVFQSVLDTSAPAGLKQELTTFGNYEILFVAGLAYYKLYTDPGWQQIAGFKMSVDAPRFWTKAVPVSTTDYYRIAATATIDTHDIVSVNGSINTLNIAGAAQGNIPGLLVQDNQNQPCFIFIGADGTIQVKTTQTFDQWHITFTDETNTVVAENGDQREYVPIGNEMEWVDGVLYVTSPDTNFIYRSVSGRPLDFMVNVTNTLADDTTTPAFTQYGGGDASTTAYSVGVGGITTLRAQSTGALFVGASNANFSVSKNMTQNAPTVFGEYTFIKTFLFNATCISDRAILDSLGDTKFIDLTGVRSFNAVEQLQNEGRNSQFTASIQSAFSGFVQDATKSAAILFDNYEFYACQTIFGATIVVYDTIAGNWSSFDLTQTGGKLVKMFSKIELTVQRLYAITEDDQLYVLYSSTSKAPAQIRTISMAPCNVMDSQGNKVSQQGELKISQFRPTIDECTKDSVVTVVPYANNRIANYPVTKNVLYSKPPKPSTDKQHDLPDVDTQLDNLAFQFPESKQGWKTYCNVTWTDGVIVQFTALFNDQNLVNPIKSQGRT